MVHGRGCDVDIPFTAGLSCSYLRSGTSGRPKVKVVVGLVLKVKVVVGLVLKVKVVVGFSSESKSCCWFS